MYRIQVDDINFISFTVSLYTSTSKAELLKNFYRRYILSGNVKLQILHCKHSESHKELRMSGLKFQSAKHFNN